MRTRPHLPFSLADISRPHQTEPTSHPDYNYGSQHGLYYLDGRLIALAVLDVLPGAVSSVYLAWDPAYAGLGLGKISALREIAMVREMREAGVEGMEAYMMGESPSWGEMIELTADDGAYRWTGYYIHTCPKMRYKGEYQPSSLLDPVRSFLSFPFADSPLTGSPFRQETNTFYPFEHCIPLLDANPHASFSARPSLTHSNTSTASLPMAIPSATSNRSASPPSPHSSAMMTPLAEKPSLSDEDEVKKVDGGESGGSTEGEGDPEDGEEEDEDEEISWPVLPPPGCLDPLELPKALMMSTCVLENRMLVPLLVRALTLPLIALQLTHRARHAVLLLLA